MGINWRRIKNSSPKSIVRAAFGVALVIFVTSTTLGVLTGRQMSPAYTDPTLGPLAVAEFAAHHLAIELGTSKIERDAAGRIVTIDRPIEALHFVCEPVVYLFSINGNQLKEDSVGRKNLDGYVTWMNEVRKPLPSLDVALGALIGAGGTTAYNFKAATGGLATAMKHASGLQQIELALTAFAALGSGYGLGFWWTYEPLPRCGELSIKQALGNPAVWSRITRTIQAEKQHTQRYEFKWSQSTANHLLTMHRTGRQILPYESWPSSSNSSSQLPPVFTFPKKDEKEQISSMREPSRERYGAHFGPFSSLRTRIVCDIYSADKDLSWRVFVWTENNQIGSDDTEEQARTQFASLVAMCDREHVRASFVDTREEENSRAWKNRSW